jgi:hypothetical protein
MDDAFFSRFDAMQLPADAVIRQPLVEPVAITDCGQLGEAISRRMDEKRMSAKDVAYEAMVREEDVRRLAKDGRGSIHDALVVLEALGIKMEYA